MILKIIYYILLIITNIYGLYFIFIALPSLYKKRRKPKNSIKDHYFTILIPARNEEFVIGNLINSLNKLNYPKDKYEVLVVLNNSTDNTKEVVKSLGANYLECKNEIHSKGDALKETFEVLSPRSDIDAYIIFDADNVVDKDFLVHMNNSINNGYQVAQGFRDSKNAADNWLSCSYAIYYYIQNYFFNKARTLSNSSASINGTGFMVKKEVIDKIGFNTKTITEDIEFSGICAINNIKIDFVEKAVTYDEQPTDFKISWHQRKRWSKGCLDCYKNYSHELYKNTKNNKSCLDLAMMYMAPMVQDIALIMLGISAVNKILSKEVLFTKESIITSIIFSIAMYLAQVILSTFVILINKKPLKKYLSGILLFPVFIITWLPINVIILFQKNIKWKHIPHNKNITIDEV